MVRVIKDSGGPPQNKARPPANLQAKLGITKEEVSRTVEVKHVIDKGCAGHKKDLR